MITHDQILPALYHLQRQQTVGAIQIVSRRSATLIALSRSKQLAEAFPNQAFDPLPPLDAPPQETYPDLFQTAIAALPPGHLVVVAVPDHVHMPVIDAALEHGQHVLAVKPLVPTYAQAKQIERRAAQKGLFVGVEYHKRFDRRARDARGLYRSGRFGQFRCGEARMIEPYCYRHSNFQNWFTTANSDPFTYVGCHYVDLVRFITGLRPVEVSVRGIPGTFPNGNVGYLWAQGRVVWDNGALLNVTAGLGYPDEAAGPNDQGLVMYCEGDDCGAILQHDDQYRGVCHGYVDRHSGPPFRVVSPDYLRFIPRAGEGKEPVGYGFDSIEALVRAVQRVNAAAQATAGDAAVAARRREIAAISREGLLATPANSWTNELVTEAARISIARHGQPVAIEYDPTPRVRLRR
jgi:predicted dehydrogenase